MQNYFHIFNLPEIFALDMSALQPAYVTAQQATHPDRQIGKTEAKKLAAAQQSAATNAAYRVLRDDYQRAVHLLELQGVILSGDAATVKPDAMLLMEVMEMNEAAEAAAGNGKQITNLQRDYSEQKQKLIAQIAVAFDAKDTRQAAQLTLRLNYLNKTLQQLHTQL